MLGFCSSPHRAPPLRSQRLPSAGPATPAARGRPRDPGGSARHVVRKRAGRRRGREAPRAGRGAAGGESREGPAWGCEGRGGRHGRCGRGARSGWPALPSPARGVMLPGPPRRWDAGKEQALEEHGSPAGSDPGETSTFGEEALEEPGTPPQDSPQPRSRRPSWTRRELLLSRPPPGLAAEHSPGTPALSPQMAWEVAPSRMTVLAPWDPNYKAKAGPRLVWCSVMPPSQGPSCAPGTSFSGRTLCHPSLWPLYEAASGRDLRSLAPATGHQNGEHEPRDAGFPVMCCEDVFVSDPLLPCGQRIPLYLSEASQQVMGSLKLLLPPPIMSPWVLRTPSPGCPTAWLSGPELIALTGLLQMSQGPPRPVALEAPTPPAGPPDPVSDHPDPSGGPSCSHCTDPSAPQTPDTH
ncbi:histone deacetylase complex subunit SAP25 isoform X2 [Leopardus geoffroyi]|uniref:histone deacetylase complex subunit SAP25 isoform X2 n=1 Tax=Leopardus geoffroyi TaxID=46844 RepID=UPI001E265DB6|nr:histone deacetylase complex subunit SAP25 isoform X2 [Leopardus geoffroyi]